MVRLPSRKFSPYGEVTIPEVPLHSFVLQRAQEMGDKPALIDGPSGRTLTYLQQRGLKKGEVVAIFSPNLPEYALVFHGILAAGGTVTTINPLYTPRELNYQLKDARARFIFTIPPFVERVKESLEGTQVEEIFVIGEAEGATPLMSLLQTQAPAPQVTINPKEDLAALPYSSGTTGLPKGVMLTHYNLVANIVQSAGVEPVTEKDVLIGVLPFYHIYGMTVILNFALYKDRHHTAFRPGTVPGTHREASHHPHASGPSHHPGPGQTPHRGQVRPVQPQGHRLGRGEVARAASQRVGALVKQGYGLTETSPVTHLNPDDPAKVKLASVGPPIPNTECRVVDLQTGEDLGPGQLGEILIRGPQVMKGYLNNPEATAAALDSEGWLRTGDVGYVDEDGYFYIVDRIKEMIKYKGWQVAPAELEAILLSHPAVADAAVIPSPDPEAGEVPKAFVVKKAEVTEKKLITLLMAFVAERVAAYKKIRKVEFVEQIPKTLSGKILRRVLIEQERKKASQG